MIKYLLLFIISFIVVYLFYFIFVILNKKKNKNILETNQASIFINLNKLDKNKINEKKFIQILSICNSFVLALTFDIAISSVFDSLIINLLLSFVILIILILVVYKVAGLFFRKKD